MKKITVIFMLAMLMSACTSESVEKNDTDGYMEVTISAQLSDNETKTIRETDKSVSWLPNEKINIICGNDKAMFTSNNTERASVATFSGQLLISTVIGATEGNENNAFIWGLYPYDANVESDGTYVTTTLPNVQTGVSGTFADELFLTLARSQSFNLGFYSVCSGFKFSLTNSNITSISFSGNNNENLAGKARLTFVDGVPSANILEGQKTITLTPENGTFETGVDYYFVFFPTVFENGFTVTFTTNNHKSGSFIYENNVAFSRNTFVNKSNVDDNVLFLGSTEPIVFADENAKSVCVSVWDTNNDGEISFREAEAVTSIPNTLFRNDYGYNCPMVFFNELQYFTGITSIPSRCFQNCSSLREITLPANITSIGESAFIGCQLKTIIMPEGVRSVGKKAYYNCWYATSLIIPASIISIGDSAFDGCSGLQSIICKPVNPPTCYSTAFDNTNNCPIYVPQASVDEYKAAGGWWVYSNRISSI